MTDYKTEIKDVQQELETIDNLARQIKADVQATSIFVFVGGIVISIGVCVGVWRMWDIAPTIDKATEENMTEQQAIRVILKNIQDYTYTTGDDRLKEIGEKLDGASDLERAEDKIRQLERKIDALRGKNMDPRL